MGGMDRDKVAQDKTEAEAQAFIAENESLLERASVAPATLHRIVLHGGEIATRLSDEVVAEMKEKARVLNTTAAAINDDKTPPARIQELEEERMRAQAASLESTKQETFEQLSDLIQRAITLRREREVISEAPEPEHKDIWVRVPAEQPERGFWQRLFGGR
jgi:hypothetical protein